MVSSVKIEDSRIVDFTLLFILSYFYFYFHILNLGLETSVLSQTVTQHDNVLQISHTYHTERYKRF